MEPRRLRHERHRACARLVRRRHRTDALRGRRVLIGRWRSHQQDRALERHGLERRRRRHEQQRLGSQACRLRQRKRPTTLRRGRLLLGGRRGRKRHRALERVRVEFARLDSQRDLRAARPRRRLGREALCGRQLHQRGRRAGQSHRALGRHGVERRGLGHRRYLRVGSRALHPRRWLWTEALRRRKLHECGRCAGAEHRLVGWRLMGWRRVERAVDSGAASDR